MPINRLLKNSLPLLFIILCFFTASQRFFAQDLYLEVNLEKQDSTISLNSRPIQFTDFETLSGYVEKIRDSLQKTGFLDTKMATLIQKNDTLYIGTLKTGVKIVKIKVYYQDSILGRYAEKLGLATQKGHFLVDPVNFESIMADLAALEAKSGYPLSSLQLENTNRKADTLYTHLILNREILRTISKIKIDGYEQFPESYLKHYANFKTGKLFDRSKVNQKFNQLADLPFVNALKDPEVLFEKDSTTVFLYLEKNPANRFDGFLGFGNNEDSGRLRLDGYLDLHLLNNLNYGELLELNYKSDGNDQQTLRVAIELPYLFKSPLGLQAELNLFRRDTTFSTSKQELNLFYQLNGNIRFSSGILLENSTALSDSLITINNTATDYKKTLLNIGFSRVSRSKERLFPIKNSVSIKTSFGKRNALDHSENQFAIEGEASYTFALNKKQRFYIANITKDLISKRYFNNELFRLGGINSIRGFKENAINADLYSLFRSEYRYLAAPSLYVHTVADAAYFENDLLDEQGFLYSFGFGAGILTGAGLLNINLANGLQEGQDFKFSNSILHLRLTTFF